MGVVGKIVASCVFLVCVVLGALVGRAFGDASVGGNVGAAVGLLAIAVNVLVSLAVMRRRFAPKRASADGERLRPPGQPPEVGVQPRGSASPPVRPPGQGSQDERDRGEHSQEDRGTWREVEPGAAEPDQ